ncbi:hypothetical protein [Limosilactobacillus pulli]|nr:hypothetical protein [Limosilactobacillus pulli]
MPTVPGYTPSTSTVTPADPTWDTPVTYIKNQTPHLIRQNSHKRHLIWLSR